MEGDAIAPMRMEYSDEETEPEAAAAASTTAAPEQRTRQLSATTPEREHRRRSRNSILYESTGADKLLERDGLHPLRKQPTDQSPLVENADEGALTDGAGGDGDSPVSDEMATTGAAVVLPAPADENVAGGDAVPPRSPAASSTGSGRSKHAASKLSINVQASNALDAPSRSPHRCV